jgi:hypothetical protein
VFEELEFLCLADLELTLGECPVWHGQQLWLMDCRELALIEALNLQLSS